MHVVVLAVPSNTVVMCYAGIKFAMQWSWVPHPAVTLPAFVSCAIFPSVEGRLDGTLQAGTFAGSDCWIDLDGLGGKSSAEKRKDTRE